MLLTEDSPFTDFIKLLNETGACSEGVQPHEEILKIYGDKITCGEMMDIWVQTVDWWDPLWVFWVIKVSAKFVEPKLRLRCIKAVTNLDTISKFLEIDFLTDEEKEYLQSALKDEQIIQKNIDKIKDPIDAARMLLENPYLTNRQELILKGKIKKKLPNIEKELREGDIISAKSELDKEVNK